VDAILCTMMRANVKADEQAADHLVVVAFFVAVSLLTSLSKVRLHQHPQLVSLRYRVTSFLSCAFSTSGRSLYILH
jgi:hypothetical protein